MPSFAFDCSTFAFDLAPLLLTTGHKAQKAKDATFARSLTKAREAKDAKAKGAHFFFASFAFGYATQRQKAKVKVAQPPLLLLLLATGYC